MIPFGRIIAFVLVPAVAVLLAAVGGRLTAPTAAKSPPPAYQQVSYSAAGLIQTLNQQGVPIADLTFDHVATLAHGYRVFWIVTEPDGTTATWIVTTDLHGRITSITMRNRHTPQAN